MTTAEQEMDGDALRRLGAADAAAYHALRMEGFARHHGSSSSRKSHD